MTDDHNPLPPTGVRRTVRRAPAGAKPPVPPTPAPVIPPRFGIDVFKQANAEHRKLVIEELDLIERVGKLYQARYAELNSFLAGLDAAAAAMDNQPASAQTHADSEQLQELDRQLNLNNPAPSGPIED